MRGAEDSGSSRISRLPHKARSTMFPRTLMFETLYEYVTDPHTQPPGLDRLTPGAQWPAQIKGSTVRLIPTSTGDPLQTFHCSSTKCVIALESPGTQILVLTHRLCPRWSRE